MTRKHCVRVGLFFPLNQHILALIIPIRLISKPVLTFPPHLIPIASGNLAAVKPLYLDRLILLLILNAVNWGMSGYGVSVLAYQGGDFASFMLAIFISNVMLYTLFYIIMKVRHGEKLTWQPAIYCAISFCTYVYSRNITA